MSTYDSSIVMQFSGINLDVYKAHSTRAASVSAAHRAQVPVQEILRKAGWSSAQTFAIYYDKNLDTSESSASVSGGYLDTVMFPFENLVINGLKFMYGVC